MCNFNSLEKHLFQSNEIWINLDLVKSVCDLIAKYKGWDASLRQKKVACNKWGKERVRSKDGVPRATMAGPLKKQCGWKVHLKPLVKESYVPVGSKTHRLSYKEQWDKPVQISSAGCKHTNGCVPCRANRVSVTQASRNYVRKLPTRAIFTLCNYANQDIKLTHQLIEAVISPL